MACHKEPHPTREAAENQRRHAAKLRRNRGKGRPPLVVYRCEDCGYWHFGHHGRRMKAIDRRG